MWTTKLRVLKGLAKQSPNPKFSRNFHLVSSFAFHVLPFPLLILSTAT